MPNVMKRPIFRLNEEHLLFGVLPTPWFIGVGAIIAIIFMFKLPHGIGDIFALAPILIGVIVAAITGYRLSKQRIIWHWFKWHDAGIGGVVGRDKRPLPLRFQEMSEEDEQWLRGQAAKDRQKVILMKKEYVALRREEDLRQRKAPGRKEPARRA